jgi:hypothetical protein
MRKLSFCLIVLFSLFIISCAPSKTLVDTSCVGYKNVDFVRTSISQKGIGIMPVLGGSEKEQFRRPMGEAMTKYMRQEFDPKKVKSPSEVITAVNNDGLSSDYAKAIGDYITTGIVPRELAIKLGKSLSVDYLLYTRLLSDSEFPRIEAGQYSYNIKIDEIYVQCQVWDTKQGDVVWEGKGGIAKLEKNNCDVVDKTAEGLSKIIGNDKNQGPCEIKSDLTKSVQKATVNTLWLISGICFSPLIVIMVILL